MLGRTLSHCQGRTRVPEPMKLNSPDARHLHELRELAIAQVVHLEGAAENCPFHRLPRSNKAPNFLRADFFFAAFFRPAFLRELFLRALFFFERAVGRLALFLRALFFLRRAVMGYPSIARG